MRSALGMVLPEAPHDTFLVKETVDNYNDPALWVYCFFEGHTSTVNAPGEEEGDPVIQAAITEYVYSLTLLDWAVEYNGQYGAYVAHYESDVRGVELWILEGGTNGKEALGIYATSYIITKKDVWPSELLKHVIGKDVPSFDLADKESFISWEVEGDSSSNNLPYVGLAVSGVIDPAEVGVRYANKLSANGYEVLVGDYDKDNKCYLSYLDRNVAPCIYSYYDVDYDAFYIFVLPISAKKFAS